MVTCRATGTITIAAGHPYNTIQMQEAVGEDPTPLNKLEGNPRSGASRGGRLAGNGKQPNTQSHNKTPPPRAQEGEEVVRVLWQPTHRVTPQGTRLDAFLSWAIPLDVQTHYL